jgi:hypothetical protein
MMIKKRREKEEAGTPSGAGRNKRKLASSWIGQHELTLANEASQQHVLLPSMRSQANMYPTLGCCLRCILQQEVGRFEVTIFAKQLHCELMKPKYD